MSNALSAFRPMPDISGIFTAEKGNLRCTAVQLRDGGLCLYSPVQGLGPDAWKSLEVLGEVTHLLAPNHYHHKGVAEYAAAFPDATLCASARATPRLEKQTGHMFTTLGDVALGLPDDMVLVEPNGLKTGEVWIDMVLPDGHLWIVTDAFCGPKTCKADFADTPELLGTFPKFGIGDRDVYCHWLASAVQASAPTQIVPCHGAMIQGDDLGAKALRLLTDSS